MTYELYVKEIAKFCDGHSDVILKILKLSEVHKTLYHGIKRKESLQNVSKKGIEPRTIECGYASCWATGLRLFINQITLPVSSAATYDTPFFHYAHSDYDPIQCNMNLAVSDADILKDKGIVINWLNNDSMDIKQVIPPKAFSSLSLTFHHPNTKDLDFHKTREYAMIAERKMLEILLEHLENYFVGCRIYREFSV